MKRILVLLSLLVCFAARAANWYIDQAATGSANGTSWTDAWTAISNVVWASVSGGDTVYLSAGTYAERVLDVNSDVAMVAISKAGTSNNPITLTPGVDLGHSGMVVLDGRNIQPTRYGIELLGYIRVDGGASTNLMICNLVMTNNRDWGTAMACSGDGNIATRLIISNCNNGWASGSGLHHEVSSNRFYKICGDGAINDASGAKNPDASGGYGNLQFHDNFIETCVSVNHNFGGADGIKPGGYADIYNNDFRCVQGETTFNGGQHPDCVQFTACGNGCRIFNNRFYAFPNSVFEFGLELDSANILVANNVISYPYDTNLLYASHNISEVSYDGLGSPGTYSNIWWVNNTVVDGGGAFSWGWQKDPAVNQPTMTNCGAVNNVMVNCGLGSSCVIAVGGYVNTNFHFTTNECFIANNLLRAGDSGLTNCYYILSQGVFTNLTTVGTIDGDPMFVDYTPYSHSLNLGLREGSPAIGAGANLSALFQSFGLTNVDFAGYTRPAVGAWTIGAFESAQSAPATNTATAVSLRVNTLHFVR